MTTKAETVEAGRELDAMVAERVFSRRHVKGADVPEFFRHRSEPIEAQEAWVDANGHDGWCRICGNMPEFSSWIGAAWEVVEKMAERGFTFHLEWKGAGRAYEHTAEVSFMRGLMVTGHAAADTAPEAICTAALRALAALDREEEP